MNFGRAVSLKLAALLGTDFFAFELQLNTRVVHTVRIKYFISKRFDSNEMYVKKESSDVDWFLFLTCSL